MQYINIKNIQENIEIMYNRKLVTEETSDIKNGIEPRMKLDTV